MEDHVDFDTELARVRADAVAWEVASRATQYVVALLLFVLGTAWLVIGVLPMWGKVIGHWDWLALSPSVCSYIGAVWLLWTIDHD
jgi:hypothetical protein